MEFAQQLSKSKNSGNVQQSNSYYNSNFGWNNNWSDDTKLVYEYYVNR